MAQPYQTLGDDEACLFLVERDDAIGDNSLVILVSEHFVGSCMSLQGEDSREQSQPCPRRALLCVNNNSLDRLTAQSHKKQHLPWER